jgi:hypothetical protein
MPGAGEQGVQELHFSASCAFDPEIKPLASPDLRPHCLRIEDKPGLIAPSCGQVLFLAPRRLARESSLPNGEDQ